MWRLKSLLLSVLLCATMTGANAEQIKWTEQQANDWYAKQPWLVGANFAPASSINQLEMWQSDSFDPARIDTELGWAQKIGMNTMRVFLHDLAWQQDPEGLKKRIKEFLGIAQKHNIKIMMVLFDSVWHPNPKSGKQPAPTPGVHNSGWVQGPGAEALVDTKQHGRLKDYVKDIVSTFGNDDRIIVWDIWNEPDNTNDSSYGKLEPKNKLDAVLSLLPQAFAWAREANPKQPLTSGVWKGDWSSPEKMTPIERAQVDLSDVISFHNYESPMEFEKRIQWLSRYKRPLFCTEYMARGNGSTFLTTLPLAKKHKVAAYNWGLVAGKTQTFLPWDSWQQPYVGGREPSIWFHEVFREDGTPYVVEETLFIKRVTENGQ